MSSATTYTYRTMDEITAVKIADDWMDEQVKSRGYWMAGVPGVEITRELLRGEGGGVLTLWVDKRPACMAVLLRDPMNFTVLTTIEILNPDGA